MSMSYFPADANMYTNKIIEQIKSKLQNTQKYYRKFLYTSLSLKILSENKSKNVYTFCGCKYRMKTWGSFTPQN